MKTWSGALVWRVEFEADADRDMQRLGAVISARIAKYLRTRLATSEDPRRFGQPLRADLHGYWRYRVGDYRVIARIIEDRVLVVVVRVGHRSEVYDP